MKGKKKHNGVTGNGRNEFYILLDEILGHHPAAALTILIDTGSPSLSVTASHAKNDSEE